MMASMDFRDLVPEQRFQPTLAVSPDGTRVAFSANTSGQYNVWVAPIDGSASPRQVTDFTDDAVRTVAWSPDGAHLAFTADRGGDEQHQVHLIDLADGQLRRLTDVADRQHHLGSEPFSHDGTWIVYAGNDRDPAVQDIIVQHLGDGTTRRVESVAGEMLFPVAFSPDDAMLLVAIARSNTDIDAGIVDLAAEPMSLENLTEHEGEEQHVPSGWTADGSGFHLVSDAGREHATIRVFDLDARTSTAYEPVGDLDWDVEEVATSDDGAVVWVVNEGGVSVLHRHHDHATERHEMSVGTIASLDLDPAGGRAAMLLSTPTRPTEIAVVDLAAAADDRLRFLTDSRPDGLRQIEPIEPELVEYPTHDGRMIPGWLARPTGDGPFPVVLSIHGGPEAQERPVYAYAGLYQFLLAHGIGVFAPNVRGSSGYGRTYQTLIHRDWGGAELGDFEHANRYLRGLDWVDEDRIAVFGGSFGGFATLSCVSRLPDLWAAGVSIVGPSNLHTFVRSVPPTWRSLMAKWVGDPELDADLLTERSPLTYADDIVVPLLVIQGANDPRVAKAESDQIVESLRARGVEVAYRVFEDEGHGFTKRENEISALTDVGEFLVGQLTGS
jgi:dipeptidyl aminopeptidase/acylaminoacyl peptidase